MNAQEFLDFYKNELVAKETAIFTLKGKEYSGDTNRFSNFERLAEELNWHPLQVLWVYASKHKDSILTYINDKKVYSNEDIIGRIHDYRNYLALMAGMIDKYRKLDKNHKWYIE